MAEAVLETQVMEVMQARVLKANQDNGTAGLGKGLQLIKVMAKAPLAEAHRQGIGRTQRKAAVAGETEEPGRGSETQETPRKKASEGFQQQGPPGVGE